VAQAVGAAPNTKAVRRAAAVRRERLIMRPIEDTGRFDDAETRWNDASKG